MTIRETKIFAAEIRKTVLYGLNTVKELDILEDACRWLIY